MNDSLVIRLKTTLKTLYVLEGALRSALHELGKVEDELGDLYEEAQTEHFKRLKAEKAKAQAEAEE